MIKNFFGRKFLEHKYDPRARAPGKRQNPVQFHWCRARDFLKELAPNQKDLRHESLAYIAGISHIIERTQNLPGFDSEIAPNLKGWAKFDSAEHEMSIGARCTRFSSVEFLPTEKGRRTADLRVSLGEDSVYVECKRKQRLEARPLPPSTNDRLRERAERMMRRAILGLDVLVVVLGTDQAAIDGALEFAEERISTGGVGIEFDERRGACVRIYEEVRLPPQRMAHGFNPLATIANPAGVMSGEVLFRIDEHDRLEIADRRSFCVLTLDSHRFNEIRSTFTEKRQRQQIPDENVGVFCFHLDLRHLRPVTWQIYLEVVAHMLCDHAWRGGHNTRVGGILFTCSFFNEDHRDGWSTLNHNMLMHGHTSPSGSIPEWFKRGINGDPPL